MTETMPAFGTPMNIELVKLLGWTNLTVSHGMHYGHAPGSVFVTAIPDFCRDDAACFGLMVTLQDMRPVRGITLRHIGDTACAKISTDLLNYSDGWTYDACEQSTLAGAGGWRDAITQAAWEVLTAVKETE